MHRRVCRQVVTSSLPHYVEAMAEVWIPGYLATGVLPADVPRGAALRKRLSALRPAVGSGALTKKQRELVSILMVLRWAALRIMRLMRYLQCVAKVQHRSGADAMPCCLGIMAMACDHRHEGRSWGLATDDGHCRGILKGTFNEKARATVRVADGAAKLQAGAPRQMEGWSDVSTGAPSARSSRTKTGPSTCWACRGRALTALPSR
jgi:hypothetical protein